MTPEVEAAGGKASAEAARSKAEEAGKKRLEAAKALAAKAFAGDAASEEPARKALKEAAALGLPAVGAEAETSLAALDAALRERGEALRVAEEAWPRACAESLTAAAASMREGTAVLDAAAGVLAPLAKRVEDLRRSIALVGAFSESIRGGFSRAAAAGESIKLRVPSRPGGSISGRASGLRPDGFEIQRGPAAEAVAARDVHPEDLAALAWKVLGTGSPDDHVGAAAFLLGRGAFPAADREIEILDVMGAKDRAELVRSLVSAVRGNARQRADAVLREAEVLRIQKRTPEARAAYERAVSVCDGYAPTLWKQGAFLLEASKDPAEALRSLEAAAALDPAEPEAWYWIGEGRRRAGKFDEALAAFDRFAQKAAADDPRREAVRKAQEELRTSATAASMKQVREEAARTYRKDEFAASEALWRKVLAAAPEDTEAMYFLGKSLLALDSRIDAYAWLRKYLGVEKKPGSRTDDARKIVKDLEQRFGDSPAAIRKAQEGSNLINQGAWSAAIDTLTASLDLAPLRAESYMERGRGHLFGWAAEGRKEHLFQAAKDLETAVLINDRLGRAWSILAETRFRLDDVPGAVEASTRAVQYDPTWIKAWEFRARVLNRAGRFLEAEQAATDGLAKEQRPTLYIARGDARFGLGKIKDAKADLDAAVMKFPQLTEEEKDYRLDVLARIRRAGVDSE
jgi:tetratricopeptide (TPR) repeat protein